MSEQSTYLKIRSVSKVLDSRIAMNDRATVLETLGFIDSMFKLIETTKPEKSALLLLGHIPVEKKPFDFSQLKDAILLPPEKEQESENENQRVIDRVAINEGWNSYTEPPAIAAIKDLIESACKNLLTSDHHRLTSDCINVIWNALSTSFEISKKNRAVGEAFVEWSLFMYQEIAKKSIRWETDDPLERYHNYADRALYEWYFDLLFHTNVEPDEITSARKSFIVALPLLFDFSKNHADQFVSFCHQGTHNYYQSLNIDRLHRVKEPNTTERLRPYDDTSTLRQLVYAVSSSSEFRTFEDELKSLRDKYGKPGHNEEVLNQFVDDAKVLAQRILRQNILRQDLTTFILWMIHLKKYEVVARFCNNREAPTDLYNHSVFIMPTSGLLRLALARHAIASALPLEWHIDHLTALGYFRAFCLLLFSHTGVDQHDIKDYIATLKTEDELKSLEIFVTEFKDTANHIMSEDETDTKAFKEVLQQNIPNSITLPELKQRVDSFEQKIREAITKRRTNLVTADHAVLSTELISAFKEAIRTGYERYPRFREIIEYLNPSSLISTSIENAVPVHVASNFERSMFIENWSSHSVSPESYGSPIGQEMAEFETWKILRSLSSKVPNRKVATRGNLEDIIDTVITGEPKNYILVGIGVYLHGDIFRDKPRGVFIPNWDLQTQLPIGGFQGLYKGAVNCFDFLRDRRWGMKSILVIRWDALNFLRQIDICRLQEEKESSRLESIPEHPYLGYEFVEYNDSSNQARIAETIAENPEWLQRQNLKSDPDKTSFIKSRVGIRLSQKFLIEPNWHEAPTLIELT